MRALPSLVLLLTPLAALADPLPGADDPAFRAALDAALAADDPQALRALHGLAEAGNKAALVALATAVGWYPAGTTLAERRSVRIVNGRPLDAAAAAVHPPYGLWWGHDRVDAPQMWARAVGLIASDEPRKAATVLAAWLNRTGALGDVPPGFWDDLPAAPWTRAQGLASRLLFQPGAAAADTEILARWLSEDRPEGWLVLDMLGTGGAAEDGQGVPAWGRIAATVPAGDPEREAARRGAARALRALISGASPDTLDAAGMDGVAAMLAMTGADLPVRLWCEGACPGDPGACTGAAVVAFGVRPSLVDHAAPMAAALPLADWFASPRGAASVLAAGFMAHRAAPRDPEAISVAWRGTALARARGRDACFADAVAAALPDLVTGRFAR